MLHNTHVVLDMLAVITNRRAKRKVRDHNQWFGRCLPIPPVKSILETTADSRIAALHRGGRAAIYGRVAQHERLSPFRAGLVGLKPGIYCILYTDLMYSYSIYSLIQWRCI